MSRAVLGSVLLMLATGGLAGAQMLPPPGPPPGTSPHPALAGGPPPVVEQIPNFNAFAPFCPPMDNSFTVPPEECCDPRCHYYVSGEYLFWKVRKNPSVPLATVNHNRLINPTLNIPGAVIAADATSGDGREQSGARLTFGVPVHCNWYWLQCLRAVEISGFGFGGQTDSARIASDPVFFPAVGRPFINSQNQLNDAFPIGRPGQLGGSLTIENTRRIWGGETNAIFGAQPGSMFGCMVYLAGARYMDLEEELNVAQNSRLSVANALRFRGAAVPAGNHIVINDMIATRNQFYGAQVGTMIECTNDNMFLRLSGKLGVGVTHQVLTINGATTRVPPAGLGQTTGGGFLATSSNIGRTTSEEFSFMPEVGLTFGFHVCSCMEVFLGYNFLYWSNVARPGHQVDAFVNPRLVPASPAFVTGANIQQPARLFKESDFWAHGFNLGATFRY